MLQIRFLKFARNSNMVWFYVILLLVLFLLLVACSGPGQPTPTKIVGQFQSPSPSPSTSPTRLVPTDTPTITPIPTLLPLALPTLAAGAENFTFRPDPKRTGWLGSKDARPRWGDRFLVSGTSGDQTVVGLIQFDFQSLAPSTKILFAALEITGREMTGSDKSGEWLCDLIDSSIIQPDDVTFDAVNKASVLATLGRFSSQSLAADLVNRIVFSSAQLTLLEKQLEKGQVTIRLQGPAGSKDSQFIWDAAPGRTEPKLIFVAAPASFVVISPTATADNVFAAATLVARQTSQAKAQGTPTPLPRMFATATRGLDYVVVTSVPTELNPIAATATSSYATAVAATTGTFTPFPPNWATASPLPVLIPLKSLTPVPSATPTISPMSIGELAKKPLPSVLYNKILFLTGSRSSPQVWAMDPDGSNLGLITDRNIYDIAAARERVSPDGTYLLYNAVDGTAEQIVQIWRSNLKTFASPEQITFHQSGTAFAPAWSLDGTKIAYTRILGDATQELFVFDTKNPTTWPRISFSQDLYKWNQYPSWSPDGNQLVFSSDRGHQLAFTEIWIMNADGSNAKNLGDGIRDAWAPVWVKWRQ